MQIRDRNKELRSVKASELIPHPKNWRKHPQSQQDFLRGILAEVGITDALIVRELPDGILRSQFISVLAKDCDRCHRDNANCASSRVGVSLAIRR